MPLASGPTFPRRISISWRVRSAPIGPVEQISGRGERAHKATRKTHQVFVDVGNSVLRIFNDIDAMPVQRSGAVPPPVRGLAAPIREQFEAWFDKDPGTGAQIEERQRQIRLRLGESETGAVRRSSRPLHRHRRKEDTLPLPKPFAQGGSRRPGCAGMTSKSKKFSSRLALFCDLYHFGRSIAQRPNKISRAWLRGNPR